MKYIISTGWWCCGQLKDSRAKLLGDDALREKDFFNHWYKSVKAFSKPEKILVVDSNSPVKPDLMKNDERLEFISLNENAGHASNHTGKYCGYTRAIFTGMGYAISCNVDYWVYLEQDALLYGDNIVEEAVKRMKGDFLFGSGIGTPQVLQQSFIIMKTSFIPTFLKNYSNIKYTDNQVSPELKFALSCLPYFKITSNIFLTTIKIKAVDKYIKKVSAITMEHFMNKHTFQFGYGRCRPINFDDRFFYFQHGTKDELKMYAEKCNRTNKNS
tara:strand:- start:24679 stop:25491 length:813 start_codon:yes stop_codon:yes gene_type:complete